MSHRIAVGMVVAAGLVFAPPAGAAVTASTIASPADGTAFDFDSKTPGPVVVTGTATAGNPAADQIRITCTYAENADGTVDVVTTSAPTALTPTGPNTGSFKLEINPADFDFFTCRLRAVPIVAPADYRPFTGPVVRFSGHETTPAAGGAALDDFYQDVAGPLGYWDGFSSDCSINSTYSLDPVSLGYGSMFGCIAIADIDPAGARAGLRIDGRDAFLSGRAFRRYPAITGAARITGFTRAFDPVTGDAALGAAMPVQRCANGAAAYPPACPAWEDAGLRDDAVTVGDHGGRLARHTDLWTNPGTAARQLDVWYRVTIANVAGQWRFPSDAALAAHVAGDTIPAPAAGPGSAFVADDPALAAYSSPRGSVTWSSGPSEIRFTGRDTVALHYVRTVEPGGAVPISLAVATDGPQANVDALTGDARAAMLPTAVITAPADGTTVTASTLTVTGTTSDDGPVSVQVNGRPATVATDRTWSVAVPLAAGANALTATATDADGNTATAQRGVTLATTQPAPPTQPSLPIQPPVRTAVSNRFTFSVSQAKNRKSFKLTLRLPGAGSIRTTLKRSKQTLATAKKTAKAAGKVTVTLRLSKKALKTLRRSRTLKAQLSITFTPAGGTARTEVKRLTVRAPR